MGTPGDDGGDDTPHSDGPIITVIDSPEAHHDAPPPDAFVPLVDGAVALTVSETANNTVSVGQLACTNNGDGSTRDNQWYRAFQLSDYPEIAGGFTITSVTVGVEAATSSQPITVNVGTYTGALDGTSLNLAQFSQLATGTFTPPDTTTGELSQANLNVPAYIPHGGKVLVQVVAPDMNGSGIFFVGGTTGAETHPGYLSSTTCGVTAPATTASIGASTRIIINLNGTR